MKSASYYIAYLFLIIIVNLFCNIASAQNASDWGLFRLQDAKYQSIASEQQLVVKAKFTSRNFTSALYNTLPYYPDPKLSIHQLSVYDYNYWQGCSAMMIMQVNPSNGAKQFIRVAGSNSNYARDFEVDNADNYVILADNKGNRWNPSQTVTSNVADSSDIVLCKVTATNQVLWYKSFGGSSADYAIAIKKAPDGNFIVLAQTQSADGDVVSYHGGKDIWLLKINGVDGQIIWQKTIGTAADEMPADLAVLDDGSIMVGGTAVASNLFPSTYNDLNSFVIKTDQQGNTIWTKTFGGNGYDKLEALSPMTGGGFTSINTSNAISGDFTGNFGSTDVYICRHDATGNILWTKHYGTADEDIGGTIAVNPCDDKVYASWSKQFNLSPRDLVQFPDYCQATGIRVVLQPDGNELYYFQDNFSFPATLDQAFHYEFNLFLTPSIVFNSDGHLLSTNISHTKFYEAPQPYTGAVDRSVGMVEYKSIVLTKQSDTTICSGQTAWGLQFQNDSSYTDTLRNGCGLDTLIEHHSVHVLNPPFKILSDTTLCYGAMYNGLPVYQPFVEHDTLSFISACGNGLTITDRRFLVATNLPRTFADETTICPATKITLKAYEPAIAYLWQDSSTSAQQTITGAGIYWLEVTDTFGCKHRDSIKVSVNDLYVTTPHDIVLQSTNSVVIAPQTNGSITWQPNSSLSCTTCQTTIARPEVNSIYRFTASKDTCSISGEVRVRFNTQFDIPTAFSPNNDDLNDELKVLTKTDRPFKFEVFNRLGERVFFTTDQAKGWDGYYRGVMQPVATYHYILTYQSDNGIQQKQLGHILLIR